MITASRHQPCLYEIIVAEQIDSHWAGWFDGLTLEALPNGQTRISGALPDQAALRGVLERIFDLNLTLIRLTEKSA
jgi:hypothetical protein